MELFVREAANPLVTPEMVKPSMPGYTVECTFNAGVARCGGEVLLLLRVAEKPPKAAEGYLNVPELCRDEDGTWRVRVRTLRLDDPNYDFSDPRKVYDHRIGSYVYLTSVSHLRLARSRDGVHFTVDEAPFIRPDCEAEAFGTEDARITQIGDTYWINYTAVSGNGITTGLASTEDFVTVRKHGVILVTENRDVTIFPEKIGGKYYALERPVPRQIGTPQMWVTASPDLLHWGEHRLLHLPRSRWDAAKVGGGAVPIRTDKGWLILYHGADKESNRYAMGAALLSLTDPDNILAVSDGPVLEPLAPYEREGFYPNVVFSCGAYVEQGIIHLYYGAADRVMGLARASVDAVLAALKPV